MPNWKRLPDRWAVLPDTLHTGNAGELIAYLDRLMRRLMVTAREAGVPDHVSFNRSEITVLDTIGAEGAMAMGQLAARVRMPISTTTRIVDRLVERKMVQRDRLLHNRRVVRVALAPAGQCLYEAALASRIAGAERLLQRLVDAEQRELIRLFRKIAGSIGEELPQ